MINKLKNIILTCCLLLLLGLMFNSRDSYAIPAFTRANNVECSTCHTIFPELNEYGEAFLKNGYVYFGKGKKKSSEKPNPTPVADKTVAATAPQNLIKGAGDADLLSKLKAGSMISANSQLDSLPSAPTAPSGGNSDTVTGEAKSEGILLSGVPERLPISFTAHLHGTYNPDAVNEFDFSTRSLKLNGGGNFREKIGFFGTYLLYTENVSGINNTSQTPTNMTAKDDIGELFLIWRYALDSPINIKVGRFQPKLGLWKSNNKLSTTNSYSTYSYTVGNSVFKAEQPQDAVEANVIIANRLFVAVGAVNRKSQNTKEFYGHLSAKFGGADYLTNEPEIDLNKDESVFDFLTLTLGGYGYLGTNGDPNTVEGRTLRQNEFYRVGADADLLYKVFRLKLSGVIGNDDSPTLIYKPTKSYVASAEAEYTVLLNLIGALRFEYQDDGFNKIRRIIPTVAYTIIENVKVAAEYKHEYGTAYEVDGGNSDVKNNVGTLGVTFSF